jgi:L-amino acid N-acyltransferase YncA
VSRFSVDPETSEAEFAVVVTDAWQGKGLGKHLMRRLLGAAHDYEVRRMIGVILRENEPMIGLARSLGFTVSPTDDASVVRAVMDLPA